MFAGCSGVGALGRHSSRGSCGLRAAEGSGCRRRRYSSLRRRGSAPISRSPQWLPRRGAPGGRRRRSARPTSRPAPARWPAIRSSGVSPTTAPGGMSSTPRRRAATRTRSGNGRPRPASAGESTRSTSLHQPRALTIASCVGRAKPVVERDLDARVPERLDGLDRARDRQHRALVDEQPVRLFERLVGLVRSPPVRRRGACGRPRCGSGPSSCGPRRASVRAPGCRGPTPSPANATVNACSTRPSSRTVVPAMSMQASLPLCHRPEANHDKAARR